MAPKRCRSVGSEGSVGRKRFRGAGTEALQPQGFVCISPEAVSLGPKSADSSDSDDSGPMSHHLATSDSDDTIIYDPMTTNKINLDKPDGASVTNKLMHVVTGALPALRGELAAHVRGVLGLSAHPLAAMLRTLANFTTHILPGLKKVDHEPHLECTTKDKITMNETEVLNPHKLTYLWPQSPRDFLESDDNLVSNSLDCDVSSSTNPNITDEDIKTPLTHTDTPLPCVDETLPANEDLTHKQTDYKGDIKTEIEMDESEDFKQSFTNNLLDLAQTDEISSQENEVIDLTSVKELEQNSTEKSCIINESAANDSKPSPMDDDSDLIMDGSPVNRWSFDQSDLKCDASIVLSDDDDEVDSFLRKINEVTAAHELSLQRDEEEMEILPPVFMPETLKLPELKPVPFLKPFTEVRGRGPRGRGHAGGGARGGAGPAGAQRVRPDFTERLNALHDVRMSSLALLASNIEVRRPLPIGIPLPENSEDADEDGELGVAETYADYTPAKLTFGCRHPDPVVETASLSSVESADITYKLSLPDETIRSGLLSALQLEAVVYASQAHDHVLPDGSRAGFLIGDGAGVGKGRTIAGIIFENYLKGRKRAVWVSVSKDLKYDAERDLRDIGAGNLIKVYAINKMNYNPISSSNNGDITEGVLFSTYSALIGYTSSDKMQYKTRLEQICAWCGPDFDGCIVFDECHRAKNLCPVTGKQSSKTAEFVLLLQSELPNARLVYASATGASEPKNMAYMVRLGIWGPETPFLTFQDFLNAVEKRGVGAMEIVAMDMKLRGMYIARQLSFHGVTFKIEEVPLSLAFQETYDKAVVLWVDAMQTFQLALDLVKPSSKWTNIMWGQFWGAHQRFFKYLCIAAKVRQTVTRTREALRAGKCVVIGLQSTGEARTLDQLEKNDGKLTEFICTAKGVFVSLVEKKFPDPDVIPPEECPPVPPKIKDEVKHSKAHLLVRIYELGKRLPSNTLDQLIDELGGADNVAEMTGRKGRVVQTENGQILYESRSEADVPLETLNLTEKQRFMDGEKDVAIISEAASSGISLQSDRRVKNHKRRVHITLELPWSADRAIQQFGRTHRSNQVNAPEYIFLISDLAGERRFASTVAKRLESLGALTHGDRRATETRDLSQFNIENKFGRLALRRVQQAMCRAGEPLVAPPADYRGDFLHDAAAALRHVGVFVTTEQDTNALGIPRFLNRLLGVPVKLQNSLFNYFTDTFDAIVQQAKRSNSFDLGILDLGSAGQCVRRIKCVRFLCQHATGRAPVELHTVLLERGLEWSKAEEMNRKLDDPHEGFYLSRARWNNNYDAILCVARDRSHAPRARKMFHIYRPNLGLQQRCQSLAEIEQWFVRASPLAAAAPWRAHYEHSLHCCSHRWRGTCRAAGCEVGRRVRTYHVLSGSVLAVWARLEAVMQHYRMQVVRLKTDQGLKIVGTLLPQYCVELLTEELESCAISVTVM